MLWHMCNCVVADWEMKHDAIDPQYRELRANILANENIAYVPEISESLISNRVL